MDVVIYKFEVLAAASTPACTCKTAYVVCVLLGIYVKVSSIRTVHIYVLHCVNIHNIAICTWM